VPPVAMTPRVVPGVTGPHRSPGVIPQSREAAPHDELNVYRAMFECGFLAQLVVGYPSLRIILVNRAACALTGFEPPELVGSALDALFPAGQGPTLDAVLRVAEGSNGYSTERALQRPDGSTLGVQATVSVVRDADGVPTHLLVLAQELTAQRPADEELRKAQEHALFVARHDRLTGLLSRPALVEHLAELAAGGHPAGALMLLDLDDFNLINDSLGHAVGDAVLLEVASRVADAFPSLTVARHGGDEFAVIAPNVVDRTEAVEAAEHVGASLDADVEVGGHAIRVTASVGVAIAQARGSSSTLMRNADSALAHAKAAGTGQYRLYDEQMRREVQHRVALQDGIRVALAADQFRLAYQPIVQLCDRRIVGAEALLRWTHPRRGTVAPAEFIPVAEQSGLIVPIGQWVMSTACDDVLSLQREHGVYVSVNVAARQLLGGGFADWVEEVLQRTALPPFALTVEVTESAFMEDIGPVRTAFDRLRSRGVRVSIDDFGTGYSSLARLQRLPVDVIKLDRAFVTGLDVRPEARRMAGAILELSVAIGASIVAEGVETEAEAGTLHDLGYTTAQGYVFARPMPIEELTARLGAAPAHSPVGRVA
jgi:diguanylate cyclase (GGDEF)-like protein/PAS domain S-box-containing protein